MVEAVKRFIVATCGVFAVSCVWQVPIAAGEYSEDIGNGGKLSVTSSSWQLKYYWPGPDLRYNGTFKTVPGSDVGRYIKAWSSNFDKYVQLKSVIPVGGEFVQEGDMGMQIRINDVLSEGICLKSYHCCVSNRTELRRMIRSYEDAQKKASVIQEMLKKLP